MQSSSERSSRRISDFAPVEFRRGDWRCFETFATDFLAETAALPAVAVAAYARLRAAMWAYGDGWLLDATGMEAQTHAGVTDRAALEAALEQLVRRGVLLVERVDDRFVIADPSIHRNLIRKQGQRERKSRVTSRANSPATSQSSVGGGERQAFSAPSASPADPGQEQADNDPSRAGSNSESEAGNPQDDVKSRVTSRVTSRATSRVTSVRPPPSSPLPPSSSGTDAAPTEPRLGASPSAAASGPPPKPPDGCSTPPSVAGPPAGSAASDVVPPLLAPFERWWHPDAVAERERHAQARFVVRWPELERDWRRACPLVDLGGALAAAYAWEASNPSRRKKPRGRSRFLNGWLAKEQRRVAEPATAGATGSRNGPPPPTPRGAADERFDPRSVRAR